MSFKPANLQNRTEADARIRAGEIFHYNGDFFVEFLGDIRKQTPYLMSWITAEDYRHVGDWEVAE